MALQHTSGRTLQGGHFGVGTGTHSFDRSGGDVLMRSAGSGLGGIAEAGNESFSNLCERRLAFELCSHPTPEHAVNALIHRVIDESGRKGSNGYITCPQLCSVI